jgi:hypothetical protein
LVDDPGWVIIIRSIAGILPQDVPTHSYNVSRVMAHHLTRKIEANLAPR